MPYLKRSPISCLCGALFLLAAASVFGASPAVIIWSDDRLAEVLPIDPELAPVRTNGEVELTLPRAAARPGERYLDAIFKVSDKVAAKGFQWRAEVFSADGQPFGEPVVHPVTARKSAIQFDARTPGSGFVQIELLENGRATAVVREIFGSDKESPYADGKPAGIWLDRSLPTPATGNSWVTFGVPFPAGALWDPAHLSLRDEKGQTVPAQFASTMLWAPGGSQKWLQVDAMVGDASKLQVHYQPQPSASASSLKIQKKGTSLQVDTGAASYLIEPKGALLNQISASGQIVSKQTEKGRGLYVVDQKNRLGMPAPADTTVEVESVGELVARIKVSGIYRAKDKEELARFTVWLEFAANRPECRITHHLILTRNSGDVWFKDIGWDFDLQGWQADKGLFSARRKSAGEISQIDLAGGEAAMAQISHHRYGGGLDQFTLGKKGDPASPREGEMGDWAAALSASKGLLIACHESARQHPKAFRVSSSKLGLDLFHPGTGEELDFRAPALLKRWNEGNRISSVLAASTSKLPTNAIGWSKTHSLLLCPAAAPSAAEDLAQAGRDFTFPVQACPAPEWTYQTRVVGPLYPRDKERFPDVEAFMDRSFDYWAGEQEFFGEYGFVDFFAGPHHTRQFPQPQGRFRASYTLRNAFWLLYLRSGEAKFREIASGSNRTYLDGYLAAWDGPSRQRGLYIHSVGDTDPYAGLPFYWEGFTRPGMGTHTNLDQFLLDYLLTGNPRAKDGVLAYVDGVKKWWSTSQNDWRIIAVLRAINRAYSFTWDPELRIMQEKILAALYDPQSPVYLTYKGRPYNSSTYKTQEDLSAFIEGWELHGTRRYWRISTSLSRFWWQSLEPGSRFEQGRSGEFLWSVTGDPSLPERLWLLARQESTLSPVSSSAAAEFRFQGMPYALSAIATSGADQQPVASWLGVEVMTGRAAAIISKKAQAPSIEAYLQFERSGLQDLPNIQMLGNVSKIGQRLITLKAGYGDGMLLTVPPETEAADIFIPIPDAGAQQVFLNGRAPLVLYADGWWKPGPDDLVPPANIYFQLPADTQDASIQFEKDTVLTAPTGAIWPSGKAVRGKVSLPADLAGIWHFASVTAGAVRVKNIPPVFSFEIPEFLSNTKIEIPPAPLDASSDVQKGMSVPEGKVLSLTNPRPDLPFHEGTIEFFYKPSWNSFDLKDPSNKRMLSLQTKGGNPWTLGYVVNSERGGWPGEPWSKSHVLEMEIDTKGPARKTDAVCIRRTVFEKDQWVHIAIVWGQRIFGYTADRATPAFDVKVFVDGKEGRHAAWPRQLCQAAFAPESLSFGPNIDGEISSLRISENQRYKHDFVPPLRDQITSDGNALMSFPLINTLDASSANGGFMTLSQP